MYKKNSIIKQKSIINFIIICIVSAVTFVWSCDEEDISTVAPHDPSKPVQITDFEPKTGGLATKVLISGSNFGGDLSKINVWFTGNEGQTRLLAPLVGSNGDNLYVLTPRLSGLTEISISVEVEGATPAVANTDFIYRTMTTVTTIAGRRGTTEFVEGTLSEASFLRPHTLCVDDEGNIFVSHWGRPNAWVNPSFVLVSPHGNRVVALHRGTEFGAPTVDADGVVIVPTDPTHGFFYFDPQEQWAPRQRQILQPTEEMLAERDPEGEPIWRAFNIDWKHSMTYSAWDGMIYTRGYNAQLVKFDPQTRFGSQVNIIPAGNSNSYPYVDPNHPYFIYIAYNNAGQIWRYDLRDNTHVLYAGQAIPGWKDGFRLDAEFRGPTQIVILPNGDMYVADSGNHCIRKITPDGMVTTLIGKGGIAGYQDGNPEDALFDTPTGIAIGKDGSVYVADSENQAIRRLAEE